MFKKRKCKNCDRKIDADYDFCPHCGKSTNYQKEDWGLLGKNDSINGFENLSNSMFGGGILGKMIGSTMKILERELQKELKNQKLPNTNFELFINGKRVDPKNIKVSQPPIKKEPQQARKILPEISSESLKKISKLPKQEPTTNIRRLADRVVYEINLPEVKSIKDISIIKLESSTEIKALGNNKAYFKVIPINFPIINYNFLDEKLILEFDVKN